LQCCATGCKGLKPKLDFFLMHTLTSSTKPKLLTIDSDEQTDGFS